MLFEYTCIHFLHAHSHEHKALLLRWNRFNCWVYFEINNNKLAPFQSRPFHVFLWLAFNIRNEQKKIDLFWAKLGEMFFPLFILLLFFSCSHSLSLFFCFIACILHKHCLISVRNDCVLFLCECFYIEKKCDVKIRESLFVGRTNRIEEKTFRKILKKWLPSFHFSPQINTSKNNSEIFAQLKSDDEHKVGMRATVIFQAIYIRNEM